MTSEQKDKATQRLKEAAVMLKTASIEWPNDYRVKVASEKTTTQYVVDLDEMEELVNVRS